MSQQLAELERERLQAMLEALERIKLVAKPDDVELLARELGITHFMKSKQENRNGQNR